MSLTSVRKIHVVTLLFVMFLLLVFALLGTSEASEQSPLRLSLERAIELAIAESETVMQERQRHNQERLSSFGGDIRSASSSQRRCRIQLLSQSSNHRHGHAWPRADIGGAQG